MSFDVNKASKQELEKAIDELKAKRAGGESVVIPGEDAVVTSATSKTMGADALSVGDDQQGNFSYFGRWGVDPGAHMNNHLRRAYLKKSLNEVGYQYKGHWDSMGDFIQEGWHKSRTSDFAGKHASSYEGVSSNFFKARGMSTMNGEDGGFLVNPEIAPTVEWLFNDNDLSSRIDTRVTSQPIYKLPRARDLNRNDGTRHGGVQSYWIDEGAGGTESRPKLAFTELRMKKLAVFVFMSSEIASDTAYAIEQYVKTAVREEVNFAINRAIMWGAGGVEPVGFVNGGSTVTVAKNPVQANETFEYSNVLDMLSQLYRTSSNDSVWLHHQSVIPQLGSLSLNNHPVYINHHTGGASQKMFKTLMGRQAIESELCAPIGNKGDVWYIDPKGYKAITQSLVREDVSTHVEFMTDQNCLRFIFRFDGRPMFDQPITPFKSPGAQSDPPQQSSFLNLEARI